MAAAHQIHDLKLIVKLPESSKMEQLLSMFDDVNFIKQIILDTHTPHHSLALDLKALFSLIENTLRASTSIVDSLLKPPPPAPTNNAPLLITLPDCPVIPRDSYSAAEITDKTVIINPPVQAIREVTCQITCKVLEAKNLKEMVVELFKQLSGQWVGKAVVTLAALAIYYYDFWSLAATETSNKLPLSIAILKGIPAITKIEDYQRIQIFGMINEIIKMSFEMTRCIVEFEQESKAVPELSTVIDIAPSVIQIIFSILSCSIYFSSITTTTSLDETSIAQALPVFMRWVNMILHVIMRQLEYFRQKKEEYVEYQRVQQIFAATSVNMELIAALISTKDIEAKPLYWGSNHTTVTIECLRKKKVLLLISTVFTLSPSDLSILINIYKEPKFQLNQYEILWVPVNVVDQDSEQQQQLFETLKSQMPWYSINSLNQVSSIGVKIIMEKWHFRPDSTSIVVLDQHGKVECQNAMHMIQMWGFHSFPFTDAAVTSIWANRDVTWFDLLISDLLIHDIEEAIKQEQLIFLYGGGESSEAQQFDQGIQRITADGISISTYNVTNVQLFWTRLESCIFSMMQAKIDLFQPMMEDILKIYTNFKKGAGFLLLIKGKQVIINASLTLVLKLISDYDTWKTQISGNRFEIVVQDQYFKLVNPNSQPPACHYLFIPNMVGYMPQNIKCPTCPRLMNNIVRFECCHGAH